MTSLTMKRLTLGAALLALAAQAAPAAAQYGQAYRESASSALARHIRTLAASPRNLEALLGAGAAALEVGDTAAALAFFGRAEEVAPRDGRVKAGMGSAFVQTEQAQAALRLFSEATALGLPPVMFAKDRGLAYDMVGNPQLAQADYRLALQRGPDAEVERRLALSRAITGDREGALAALDAQLKRQDRAGWRAQAFVLALTGDTAGAVNTVRSIMPAQAAQMQPFLARLPQLSDADQALAVHFGHFPSGALYAAAPAQTYSPPAAAPAPSNVQPVNARRPDPAQPSLGRSRTAASSQRRAGQPAPARTQRSYERSDTSLIGRPATDRNAAARTQPRHQQQQAAARQDPIQQPAAQLPAAQVPVAQLPVAQLPLASQPANLPPPVQQQSATQTAPAYTPQTGAQTEALPVATSQLQPSSAAIDVAAPRTEAPASSIDFADVAAAIASLPGGIPLTDTKAEPEPPKPVATKPAAAKKTGSKAPAEKPEARTVAAKPAAKKADSARPKEPSRVWVQLAIGQNKSVFPAEFRRLKAKASKLLSDKTAWTAPLRATNRLLIGPFKTDKEARDLVNELKKVEVDSYSWTSAAGEAVEKLSAK